MYSMHVFRTKIEFTKTKFKKITFNIFEENFWVTLCIFYVLHLYRHAETQYGKSHYRNFIVSNRRQLFSHLFYQPLYHPSGGMHAPIFVRKWYRYAGWRSSNWGGKFNDIKDKSVHFGVYHVMPNWLIS